MRKGGGFGEKADTRTDARMHRVNMKPHVNVFDRNGENCRYYTTRQGEFGKTIHWRVDLIVLQFVQFAINTNIAWTSGQ